MKYLQRLFGETEITWKTLIIFSILIGIVVGVLNRVPFLENTSFTDIAVVLEVWIVLAIFIIVNSKTWQEAVMKTFIFFLISQPLVYFSEAVIEAIITHVNPFERFWFYIDQYYIHGGRWGLWTLLTIPGAFIAYQIKSKSVISGVILSVATGYLAFAGANGFMNLFLIKFPNHLLNVIFCLFFAFALIFIILKSKTARIIAIVITMLGLVGGVNCAIETKRNNDYWEQKTQEDYVEYEQEEAKKLENVLE